MSRVTSPTFPFSSWTRTKKKSPAPVFLPSSNGWNWTLSKFLCALLGTAALSLAAFLLWNRR